MKQVLALLVFSLPLICVAQTSTPTSSSKGGNSAQPDVIEPITSHKNADALCHYDVEEKDEFTGDMTREIITYVDTKVGMLHLTLAHTKDLYAIIVNYSVPDITSMVIKSGNKMLLKFDNDSVLNFISTETSAGEFDDGSTMITNTYLAKKSDFQFFMRHVPSRIRIYMVGDFIEDVISLADGNKISKSASCILQ